MWTMQTCCEPQEQNDFTREPQGSRKALINDKVKWLQLLNLCLKPYSVSKIKLLRKSFLQ